MVHEEEPIPDTPHEIINSIVLDDADNERTEQCVLRLNDQIGSKHAQSAIQDLKAIPMLLKLIKSQRLKTRWAASHILAVLSFNPDAKEVMKLVGESVNSGNYRCSGTSNAALVRNLVEKELLKSIIIAATMFSLDRGDYAPKDPYLDRPQFIGYGKKKNITTISAPHMHAHALEFLCGSVNVRDCRVLDVGCGSGYLTCAFAKLNPMAKVIGIDVIKEMVLLSDENIRKNDAELLDSGRIVLSERDGWEGYEEHGPYDLIHVGAAAASIPRNLLKQLKVGGKMFIPVGPDGGGQKLKFIERTGSGESVDDNYVINDVLDVRYVPLVNQKALQ